MASSHAQHRFLTATIDYAMGSYPAMGRNPTGYGVGWRVFTFILRSNDLEQSDTSRSTAHARIDAFADKRGTRFCHANAT